MTVGVLRRLASERRLVCGRCIQDHGGAGGHRPASGMTGTERSLEVSQRAVEVSHLYGRFSVFAANVLSASIGSLNSLIGGERG